MIGRRSYIVSPFGALGIAYIFVGPSSTFVKCKISGGVVFLHLEEYFFEGEPRSETMGIREFPGVLDANPFLETNPSELGGCMDVISFFGSNGLPGFLRISSFSGKVFFSVYSLNEFRFTQSPNTLPQFNEFAPEK